MAQGFDTIETGRLLLRGIDESDAELIVEWRSVPDVYRFFKSPHKITFDEHMNWYRNSYLKNSERFDWICIEKESKRRIGVFGLIRDGDKAQINYLLAPEGQHKGFAAEAVSKLIEYATEKWNCKQVVAEIHRNNKPSLALVVKLGFKKVSEDEQFEIYGITV
ncbi:MAG: GNAT family N-acetyltransferase [Clostridiales bacterium]|nr:GNAT family N-acetyltransferase [Clostridiales bacterium]